MNTSQGLNQRKSPTINEIRQWAYSENEWPDEEWDLLLSWTKEIELFIELATDCTCPKQSFFLHMLYYLVGITFTEPDSPDKFERIKRYSDKGIGIRHGDIKAWRCNIDDLLLNKAKYDYNNWRGGLC